MLKKINIFVMLPQHEIIIVESITGIWDDLYALEMYLTKVLKLANQLGYFSFNSIYFHLELTIYL